MENSTLIITVVAVVIVIAIGAWLMLRKRRTESLKQRFGPEYDRAVREHGDLHKAEAALGAREKRVEAFHVISLSAADRDRFAAEWKAAQSEFVDNPKTAIQDADRLVAEVMRARGYPLGDFDQRAADISVDHPLVIDNYRRAHAIALHSDKEGATTEEMRSAMIHYRILFEELLGAPAEAHRTVGR